MSSSYAGYYPSKGVMDIVCSRLERNAVSLDKISSGLNQHQLAAVKLGNQDALILAGAGSGKTKTIVARAAYLISQGTPAHRIKILTFTRRAASEIVERVKSHLGEKAAQLSASTFHTWCVSLIHRAPLAFGAKGFSVIDRDDQLQLYKVVRANAKPKAKGFLTAGNLCDVYSLARNTCNSLTETLMQLHPDQLPNKELIAEIMRNYEQRKRDRKYLDYDDILDIVAQRMHQSAEVRDWVCSQYDHILVDEMQDTNPLQWSLLSPLIGRCVLFCVGDDAQSIYAFRGADFRNIHSFTERVPTAVVHKLTENYRSTQEILDVSNWLLKQSPLEYGKQLVAARGAGQRPQLHTFSNEWEEGAWVAEDIQQRHADGDTWSNHMILVRSSYSARPVESALIAAEIPYRFIGGTKLFESAHVRDLLSLLRIVGNPTDEIALMRYVTLFPGVGEVTANRVIEPILKADSLESAIAIIRANPKIPQVAGIALIEVEKLQGNVPEAIGVAFQMLEPLLEARYANQDWTRRKRDFPFLQQIAQKHTSILAFIEEYLLDPLHHSQIEHDETDDIVTLITVHSAKGTECKTCFVINVSPGAWPGRFAAGDSDDVEEERRVLYVAMTRAMDNLIITRYGFNTWAFPSGPDDEEIESYFLNDLPDGLVDELVHNRNSVVAEATAFVETPADAEWRALVARLPLHQSARSLALHCQLIDSRDNEIRVSLSPRHQRLMSAENRKNIQSALGAHFGIDVSLTITVADSPSYKFSAGINLE